MWANLFDRIDDFLWGRYYGLLPTVRWCEKYGNRCEGCPHAIDIYKCEYAEVEERLLAQRTREAEIKRLRKCKQTPSENPEDFIRSYKKLIKVCAVTFGTEDPGEIWAEDDYASLYNTEYFHFNTERFKPLMDYGSW